MPWRKWNVIIVLILANYVVFGLLAAFVFPVRPQAPLIHTAQPTFTPGTKAPQRVGTLSYDFLTPSLTARPTNTSTRTPTGSTATPTEATTPGATSAMTASPLVTATAASTVVLTATPAASAVPSPTTATRAP